VQPARAVVVRPVVAITLIRHERRPAKFLAATIALAVISLGATESVGSIHPVSTASNCVSHAGLPDLDCTSGALNPKVKQKTINNTICVPSWTDTVRPSTSYTNKLKVRGIADYGFKDKTLGHYEEDHLIPLALVARRVHPRTCGRRSTRASSAPA
jgi:hypothetical protein